MVSATNGLLHRNFLSLSLNFDDRCLSTAKDRRTRCFAVVFAKKCRLIIESIVVEPALAVGQKKSEGPRGDGRVTLTSCKFKKLSLIHI